MNCGSIMKTFDNYWTSSSTSYCELAWEGAHVQIQKNFIDPRWDSALLQYK